MTAPHARYLCFPCLYLSEPANSCLQGTSLYISHHIRISHPYSLSCQSPATTPGGLSQEVGYYFWWKLHQTSAQKWIWQCLMVWVFSALVSYHFQKKEELMRKCRAVSGWFRRRISFPVYWKTEEGNESPLDLPARDGPCGLHQPLQFDVCCCALACSLASMNTSSSSLLHTTWDCSTTRTQTPLTQPCHITLTPLRLLLGVIWTGTALVCPHLTTSEQSVRLHTWWLL